MAENRQHWPRIRDYEQAVLSGDKALARPLRGMVPEHRPSLAHSLRFREGNFGAVIRLEAKDRAVAAKVFKRSTPDLATRYAAIKEFLADRGRVQSLVGFDFLDKGVYAAGHWRPVLVMEWCRGQQLDSYIKRQLAAQGQVDKRSLCVAWLNVVDELRLHRIGHGDLQHGNIFVDPSDMTMRLVDYDGMYVPTMPAGLKAPDRGHPAYQHPYRTGDTDERLPVTWDEHVDCFAALVVLTNLAALSAPSWQRLNGGDGDRLLTAPEDLADPETSASLAEIKRAKEPVPSLVDLLIGAVRNLDSAEDQLREAAALFERTLSPVGGDAREPSSRAPMVIEPVERAPDPVAPQTRHAITPEPEPEPVSEPEAVLGKRTAREVETAILGLTVRQRAYLRCAFAGRTPESTAALLNVQPATAERRTRELLEKVRLSDPEDRDAALKAWHFGQLPNRVAEVLRERVAGNDHGAIAAKLEIDRKTVSRYLSVANKRLLATDEDLVEAAVHAAIADRHHGGPPPSVHVSELKPQPEKQPEPPQSNAPPSPTSGSVSHTLRDIGATLLVVAALILACAGFLEIFGLEWFLTDAIPGGWLMTLVTAVVLFLAAGVVWLSLEDDDSVS